jgi:hypothetical protein
MIAAVAAATGERILLFDLRFQSPNRVTDSSGTVRHVPLLPPVTFLCRGDDVIVSDSFSPVLFPALLSGV